jgi:hypothetical protein
MSQLASTVGRVMQDGRTDKLRWLAVLMFFVLMFGLHPRLLRLVDAESAATTKVRTDNFLRTVKSLVAVVIAAAILPCALLVLGWQLRQEPGATPFAHALSAGLYAVAYLLFGYRLIVQLMRDHGIGAVQFRWQARVRWVISRHLR